MGSIVRAIFSLAFILGVSGGLIYWVYITQFSESHNLLINANNNNSGSSSSKKQQIDDKNSFQKNKILSDHRGQHEYIKVLQTQNDLQLLETFRRSKAMLDMEINFSQEEKSENAPEIGDEQGTNDKNQDEEEQLYIDAQGNLHKLSELIPPKKVEEKPFIVQAVTTTTTTTTTTTEKTTTTTEKITTTTETSTTTTETSTTTTTELTTTSEDIATTVQDIQLEYHFVSSEESMETTTVPNYVTEDNVDENDLVQESSVNHDQYLSDFLFEGFMPTPMVKQTLKDLPGRITK